MYLMELPILSGKPSSPAALNFTVIQKYVYFVWKRGFNGGHPQTFVIQLSKDSTDNYINHTTVIEEASIGPDDTVTFNITSLDVGVYHARLLTFNAIGAADPVMFGVFRIAKAHLSAQSFGTADVDQGKAIYMSLSRQAVQCKTHVHLKSEDNAGILRE
ncbi:hypothetical protein DPMN_080047 [Dreissena polymorpha]|uniref:Uncharacterized protein n=1 Tax=Dreissena polymorpha TaxID=45954 RepID=A0A9D4BIW2_DREPO|nr:hypothetical protein DPMN_080047 [Dreissena polymorpha]